MANVAIAAVPADHGARDHGNPRSLHRSIIIAIAVILAIAPFVLYPVFLMKVLCFALFALAFNLLQGYGGLLSFGHAAFFGMAGYATAHAAKMWGFTPELSILFGTVVGALLGLAIGALAIRRQGIYFSMITLALAQMVFFFCLQAAFTGGEDGIQGVPRGDLLGLVSLADDRAMYVFVCMVFLASLAMIYRIIHSPFGQALKAIRDNEPRAVSLGFRTAQYKLATFVLSAAFAGLAGGMKALVFQLASLTDVHWSMSGEVVLMTLVGGMGTVFGPIVGALVMVSMQNYLAQFGAWVTIIQGVVFVVCVLVFREGIVGLIARLIRRPL
ncbi:MAG: inner-rane translocator [Xanthobacteraceae bacterium]|jgi:branched-chain amino acid transport system permease protein|nr:inner-rane translocator [Xanthobacteraceae bacterium]